MPASHTLLIATVGGSPEPIVASIKHWRPGRVWFLATPESREQIVARVVPLAVAEGFALDIADYDVLDLPDGQDFGRCVDRLRQLTPVVESWQNRGEDFEVVVDITGGTKCMSSALALQARRWRCQFAYVGGSERTKENVGIVVSGKEQIMHSQNPWDALGYQAVEEATVLFDQGALAAASQLLGKAMRNAGDALRKRELAAFKHLTDAYDAWDRFAHRDALRLLQEMQKTENDLAALLGHTLADRLFPKLQRHRESLAELTSHAGPSLHRVMDLLANAGRRGREGRFDDAVARLYRAIEAIAQVRLQTAYGIADTGEVPLTSLPEPLRTRWSNRIRNGTLPLGLQDDYILLLAHDDELGKRFHELGLDDRERSPLVSRNQSILAHGFERVGEAVYRQLWDAALKLAELEENDLPLFPRLRT